MLINRLKGLIHILYIYFQLRLHSLLYVYCRGGGGQGILRRGLIIGGDVFSFKTRRGNAHFFI